MIIEKIINHNRNESSTIKENYPNDLKYLNRNAKYRKKSYHRQEFIQSMKDEK